MKINGIQWETMYIGEVEEISEADWNYLLLEWLKNNQ